MTTTPTPEILPAGMDEERFQAMQQDVERVLLMNEENKMTEALSEERGPLTYHCKNPECSVPQGFFQFTEDPEQTYVTPKCPSCGNTKVTIGTEQSISNFYHSKH